MYLNILTPQSTFIKRPTPIATLYFDCYPWPCCCVCHVVHNKDRNVLTQSIVLCSQDMFQNLYGKSVSTAEDNAVQLLKKWKRFFDRYHRLLQSTTCFNLAISIDELYIAIYVSGFWLKEFQTFCPLISMRGSWNQVFQNGNDLNLQTTS